MDTGQRAHIRQLAEELDQIVPRDKAVVKMLVDGGGADESIMIGNERGYLRLGIDLIQGVMKAEPALDMEKHPLDIDWEYLADDSSDVNFHGFYLDSRLPIGAANEELTWWQKSTVKAAELVLMGFVLLLVAAVAIGFVTIIAWIAHLLSAFYSARHHP